MVNKGQTFKEVAEIIGTTSATISRWFKDKVKFDEGGIVPSKNKEEGIDTIGATLYPETNDDHLDDGFEQDDYDDHCDRMDKIDEILKTHMHMCIKYRMHLELIEEMTNDLNSQKEEADFLNIQLKKIESEYRDIICPECNE